MWRCSEYLSRGSAGWDANKVVRGCDISFRENGVKLAPDEVARATEVTVIVRGSKTDQYNEGCLRYVGSTRNSRCLMRALHEWFDSQPGHFHRCDDTPLFTMPDGRVLTREELQADLRLGTTELGLPADRVGTHSLRVSCATWLYQAGYELECIKRHGRWVSNVVHVYLWEGSGFNDMAKKMSEAKFVLHANL